MPCLEKLKLSKKAIYAIIDIKKELDWNNISEKDC